MGSQEDAQDAVQDALLSAVTHLDSFRAEGRIDAWLSRMVANACQRMRRGRKNDPGLHEPDAELTAPDDPETEAMRARLAATIQEALLELPAQDRALVLLAEVEGWTGPELAEHLGRSPGAIRTKLARLRARLRARLGSGMEPDGA